jgi:glycosyltransferase involved in cell wall biosynthesis
MKLTVIIPVFNEERTIEQVVRTVAAVPIETDIVAVDDASVDRTPEILRALESEGLVRVFRQTRNQGKGAAVRRGIAEARGEIGVIQDADLEYQPSDFPALIRPIVEYGADAVYGSRFLGPHRVFLHWHTPPTGFSPAPPTCSTTRCSPTWKPATRRCAPRSCGR